MRLCLLLLLAARCGDFKESEDSSPPIDVDGDGFLGEDDCDSEDPAVHIRATEVCNGKDDNCDGLTDDATASDATLWYLDGDADGWGGLATTTACTAPPNYSVAGGDCDDNDPSFHPEAPEEDCLDPRDFNCDGQVAFADADADGSPACVDCDDQDPDRSLEAPERCNGLDDDCDGSIDEEGAEDILWYPDQDADGYGDPAQPLVACTPPPGYVANGEDCNDAKASHHPGAEESNCADPQDYNCDGSVGSEDLDGDGFSACTECDDRQADVFPGSVESCNSIDDNCNGLVDEEEGAPSLWYLDQDGDGWGSDLVSTSACLAPPGYVAVAGDCDDGSIRFYPGASEQDCADPSDYNCDGSVGTNDGDADGYVACEDCNDSLASVHPLA
ncbi:MAG TPA: putative metal-binding motif-containing protein, partial [Myxococcota bacterium]|nr:putative metal-binding motif-containing protein [Myxococcota bacterium]